MTKQGTRAEKVRTKQEVEADMIECLTELLAKHKPRGVEIVCWSTSVRVEWEAADFPDNWYLRTSEKVRPDGLNFIGKRVLELRADAAFQKDVVLRWGRRISPLWEAAFRKAWVEKDIRVEERTLENCQRVLKEWQNGNK